MPYGTLRADALSSSGTLSISGNLTPSQNLSATGSISSAQGALNPLVAIATGTTTGNPITLATNLPSWVKRITIVMNGISLTTANFPVFQLGYGTDPTWLPGGVGNYQSVTDNYTTSGGPTATSTLGFQVGSAGNTAANWIGRYVLANVTGTNVWVGGMSGCDRNVGVLLGGGWAVLPDRLTAIRLTVSGGAPTYDAGSCLVMYE